MFLLLDFWKGVGAMFLGGPEPAQACHHLQFYYSLMPWTGHNHNHRKVSQAYFQLYPSVSTITIAILDVMPRQIIQDQWCQGLLSLLGGKLLASWLGSDPHIPCLVFLLSMGNSSRINQSVWWATSLLEKWWGGIGLGRKDCFHKCFLAWCGENLAFPTRQLVTNFVYQRLHLNLA